MDVKHESFLGGLRGQLAETGITPQQIEAILAIILALLQQFYPTPTPGPTPTPTP